MTDQSRSAQISVDGDEALVQIPEGPQRPLVKSESDPESASDAAVKESPGPSAPPEGYLRVAEETHQYVREYIRNADQKAAFFFAAESAGLAFLHSRGTASRWLKPPDTWTFVDALAFFGMAGLAMGAAVLLAVVFPRLRGSTRGLIFFNAIAEYRTSRGYADDFIARAPADVLRLKLEHVHDLARVCRAKYQTLLVGFWLGGIGAVASLLYFTFARAG